jgi:hypothetical protein
MGGRQSTPKVRQKVQQKVQTANDAYKFIENRAKCEDNKWVEKSFHDSNISMLQKQCDTYYADQGYANKEYANKKIKFDNEDDFLNKPEQDTCIDLMYYVSNDQYQKNVTKVKQGCDAAYSADGSENLNFVNQELVRVTQTPSTDDLQEVADARFRLEESKQHAINNSGRGASEVQCADGTWKRAGTCPAPVYKDGPGGVADDYTRYGDMGGGSEVQCADGTWKSAGSCPAPVYKDGPGGVADDYTRYGNISGGSQIQCADGTWKSAGSCPAPVYKDGPGGVADDYTRYGNISGGNEVQCPYPDSTGVKPWVKSYYDCPTSSEYNP